MSDESNHDSSNKPAVEATSTSDASGEGKGGNPSVEGVGGMSRRGVLKALVSVPFIGAFIVSFLQKKATDDFRKRELLSELGVSEGGPAVIPDAISRPPGERIRVGIIGYGGEGEALVRYAGFANPEWVEDARQAAREDARNKRLETYLNQEDLNIALTKPPFDLPVARPCQRPRAIGATPICSRAARSTP
jgi:hypothetical protein